MNASKQRIGDRDLDGVVGDAARLVVAKGKKVEVHDLKKARPDHAALAAVMLGPTGNLRAPTVRRGKTLLVGFHSEAWDEHL